MTASIHGIQVNYEIRGEGHRVLLLHGWGCDLTLMRPVADRLADACRVLSLDFPGHGQSDRPPEPWGVPEYADCLTELLRQLDFTPCQVIAHSFGARVAVWIAAHQPALFTRMVLTGAAGIRPPQTEEGKKRAQAYQRAKRMAGLAEKTVILAPAARKMREYFQHKYGSRDYNALDEEMKKTFVRVISLDLSDLYDRISIPTLLLWGDQDTETPLWMGKRMEEMIPDAGLVLLEGGTHFAYLEQIDRFALITRRFLLED